MGNICCGCEEKVHRNGAWRGPDDDKDVEAEVKRDWSLPCLKKSAQLISLASDSFQQVPPVQ